MTDETRRLALSVIAGETVLGLRTLEESAAVEERLGSDADYAAEVAAWQDRLVPLAHVVPEVVPSPQLWPRIAAETVARLDAIDLGRPAAEPVPAEPPGAPVPLAMDAAPVEPPPAEPPLLEPVPGMPSPNEPAPGMPSSVEPAPGVPSPAEPAPGVPSPNEPAPAELPPMRRPTAFPEIGPVAEVRATGVVIGLEEAIAARTRMLQRRVNRWRWAAGTASAVAAGLAVLVALGPSRFLSGGAGEHFVGVVSASGETPPLVVAVDLAKGTLAVRSLQLKPEPGKSFELWAVPPGAKPVSLGLVDGADRRSIAKVANSAWRDPATLLAVSVEPAGGSPTGQATGPIVYTGRLVRAD